MGELLALDRVGASGEPAIFEALVRWINLQTPPPAEHVTAQLLRLIRFPTSGRRNVRTGEMQIARTPLIARLNLPCEQCPWRTTASMWWESRC